MPIGPVVKDYHPQIVDEQTFLAVAALKRGRMGKGGRKGPGLTNLFSHLAVCAYCAAPMLLVNKGLGPKGGNYLRCSAAKRGHRCAGNPPAPACALALILARPGPGGVHDTGVRDAG